MGFLKRGIEEDWVDSLWVSVLGLVDWSKIFEKINY